MRRTIQHLPLAILILLATYPILRLGAPTVDDGLNHFYRLAELEWHIRHGVLYPRWLSDLHYGFGSPALNFYAPLAYYASLLPRLLGFSMPQAFALSFALAAALGIAGAYVWSRDQYQSAVAGLLGAAAFGFAPYLYINVLTRAALNATWALAIAPWLFWLIRRQLLGQAKTGAFAVGVAALILTHNLSTLFFTPLLVVYATAIIGSLPPPQRTDAIKKAAGSLVHALSLAAFFLAPFALESSYIQLHRAVLDYRGHFLTLGQLFAPPAPFDPQLVTIDYPRSLGIPQAAMAGVSLVVLGRLWRRNGALLTLAVCAVLYAYLTTPASEPVWAILPIASIIQFPWRLLGALSLLTAILVPAALPRHQWRTPTAIVAIAVFFLFSLTWTFHQPFDPLPPSPTPRDVLAYEQQNPGAVGTTSNREFLPRWVNELPPAMSLADEYAQSLIPNRFIPPAAGATCRLQTSALYAEAHACSSANGFVAMFNRFYFVGWVASIDGSPAPIRVTSPHGMISVDVPPGDHVVGISLLPTWPQLIGWGITAVAILWLFVPRPRLQPAPATPPLSPAFALTLAGLLLLRLLVFDRTETPFNRPRRDSLPNPSAVHFGDRLSLIGWETPATTAASGQAVSLTLYWQSLRQLDSDYSVSVQLADAAGTRFGQSDHQHIGNIPTSRWLPDQYARDDHQLLSLAGTPPGEYDLWVAVYDNDGRLTVQGESPALEYKLGAITITRGQPSPPGDLRLIEADVAAESLSVGDPLPFTIVWATGGDKPPPELMARLSLLDAAYKVLTDFYFSPSPSHYPPHLWAANELIRLSAVVDLPADLPAGEARLAITFLAGDLSPITPSFDIGRINITVPPRSYAVPPMARVANHNFNDTIRLLGYDLAADSITLYWQSLSPVSQRLTVFVHRYDPAGNFVAGSDAPPPRPTTGWLPGEVITDIRPFAVGDHFQIGLYNSATGERFGEPYSAP